MARRGGGGRGWGLALLAPFLLGCGKDGDNSPEQGAVAPKPDLSAAANAPGGGLQAPQPGADAAAMGRAKR